MGIRTTQEDVQNISSIPTTVNLTGFIESAASIVDQVETCAGGSLSDSQLELIERWLTAHLATVTIRPEVTQKSISDASESYSRSPAGLNLLATSYGAQAMAIDTSGCLVEIYEGSPSFVWLGDDDE